MATIDSSSAASQDALFRKLGIATQQNAADRGAKETLGQDDFLKLMITQLQNQDPFAPMENGDFIAQMAQFSTVAGIKEINESLTSVTDQLKWSRIATASTLLGHSVLVPGSLARPDADGEIHGVLDLPQASSDTVITYTDAATGEALHQQNLGATGRGLQGFGWTGLPDAVREGKRPVRISATVNFGKGPEAFGASVYAKVLSASADGTEAGAVKLDVEDYGEIDATSIVRFR